MKAPRRKRTGYRSKKEIHWFAQQAAGDLTHMRLN